MQAIDFNMNLMARSEATWQSVSGIATRSDLIGVSLSGVAIGGTTLEGWMATAPKRREFGAFGQASPAEGRYDFAPPRRPE